jgi:short-subunit dehydrogenase
MTHSAEFAGRTVLITGASAGIGTALAREFARRGARLLLVARRLDRLETLAAELRAAGAQVCVATADVTREGDISRSLGVMPPDWSLDIVVANAGFGVVGAIQDLIVEDYRRQYETNVFGVLRTFYETYAGLRAARGQFVIIGSVAGHVATGGASAYASSKFAVRAISEAMRGDLVAEGIRVTLVSPGFVDSDFRRIDNRGALHEEVPDPIPGWLRVPTARAAREIVTGVARQRAEIIVTGHGKLIVFLARHFSGLVRAVIARGGARGRPEPKARP